MKIKLFLFTLLTAAALSIICAFPAFAAESEGASAISQTETVISQADASSTDISAADVSAADTSASDAQAESRSLRRAGGLLLRIALVFVLIYFTAALMNKRYEMKKEAEDARTEASGKMKD